MRISLLTIVCAMPRVLLLSSSRVDSPAANITGAQTSLVLILKLSGGADPPPFPVHILS